VVWSVRVCDISEQNLVPSISMLSNDNLGKCCTHITVQGTATVTVSNRSWYYKLIPWHVWKLVIGCPSPLGGLWKPPLTFGDTQSRISLVSWYYL
jgi:hypothetical protein